MDDLDVKHPFIERECFGIPVAQWIRILAAVKGDIEDAKKRCGGDGLGCKVIQDLYGDDHEHRYLMCGRCPMAALAGVRGVLDGAL